MIDFLAITFFALPALFACIAMINDLLE